MKLDKRINHITDIRSVTSICSQWDLHKKGYFADRIVNFQDLSKCEYGTYSGYREHDKCFHCEVNLPDGTTDYNWFTYFIPEDVLKPVEKKYRPFTLEEFLKICDVGVQIEFKRKDNGEVKHAMFIGYAGDDVLIGIYRYSLAYLFENYELFFMRHWQPFGVLDEGDTE